MISHLFSFNIKKIVNIELLSENTSKFFAPTSVERVVTEKSIQFKLSKTSKRYRLNDGIFNYSNFVSAISIEYLFENDEHVNNKVKIVLDEGFFFRRNFEILITLLFSCIFSLQAYEKFGLISLAPAFFVTFFIYSIYFYNVLCFIITFKKSLRKELFKF